jgi:hypothetical protein
MTLHGRSWRLGAGAGLFLVGLVSAGVAWATLLTPQPVVTAKGRQFEASATPGGTYLAYDQSRPGHPDRFDVYLKPAGEPRFKVNTKGVAYGGGMDDTSMIYQSVRNGQSNLRLFDLVTHARSAPAGVNSKRWEWLPTISGDWILYGQQWGSHPVNGRVILHDTNTAETRILDEQIGKPRRLLSPGQVNGDFATWDRYTPLSHADNVFLYQISTQTKTKIPVPTGKVQYSSSVTPTGTVFYARSGIGCGARVSLHEYASGTDTDTLLAKLPNGYDSFRTFAVDEGAGVTSLYFERFQCSTGKSHIYKLTVS